MDSAGGVLEIVYKVRLEGAQEIEAGAKASERWTDAEKRVAEALQRTSGPLQNLVREQRNLNAARELGLGGNLISDLESRVRNAQRRVDNVKRREQNENNPNVAAAQAFLSSRFGSGNGIMPLVGQSIKAVAGEGGIDAVMGLASKLPPQALAAAAALYIVGKAAYETGKFLLETSKASAELTQRFTDLRTQIGGTSGDAGRAALLSRITGVEAGGAARSFNERITSDPMAMGLAARFGISNTPGLYGRRNFGAQYQQAISRVSSIQNRDERERTAQALGIEQEVSRYRLLSSDARQRMGETARITSRVNNPEAERRAAGIQAAVANEAQARENLKTAFGQGFGGGAEKFLNWLADQENGIANWMVNTNAFFDRFKIGGDKKYGDRSRDALAQIDRENAMGAGGMGGNGQTLQSQQLQATRDLTAALLKNAGVYGGGERAANAIPSGLRGAMFHRQLVSGGIRLGGF